MKMKVSRLFAVTLFTPKRMVRSSLPCRGRKNSGFPCPRALRLASLSRVRQGLPQTMKQAGKSPE